MNAKQQTLGIFVLVLSLALSSCGSEQLVEPTITSTATTTPTFMPTQTATPTLTPTPTNTFTPTPDPVVVNAHAFMDPILESVEDQDPDYQDDFSDPYSGWPAGRISPRGHEDGILGYENGEYYVQADEAKFPWEGNPNKNITCLSANHSPNVNVLDFVMEVDARFVTLSTNGDWQMKFWREGEYYFGVQLHPRGEVWFHTNYPIGGLLDSYDRRISENVPSFDYRGGTNHLVVVAKGSQIAMTLNNHVVVYIDSLMPHERGRIGFVVCNFGSVPFRAQWDNLKIWNLEK